MKIKKALKDILIFFFAFGFALVLSTEDLQGCVHNTSTAVGEMMILPNMLLAGSQMNLFDSYRASEVEVFLPTWRKSMSVLHFKSVQNRHALSVFAAHHEGNFRLYIPRSVYKGKPFCAIKIKEETLPNLVFHKAFLHTIPTAQFIPQGCICRNWFYPYRVIPRKISLFQRSSCCHTGYCKGWGQSIHLRRIYKRHVHTACKMQHTFYGVHHCPTVSV